MWLANEALRRVKGSDVALLAASEPLWAAVASMLFLGDAGETQRCGGWGGGVRSRKERESYEEL